MTVLLIFIGGGVGSVLRYLTDRFVQARHRLGFPLGTLLVNVVACFILGIVTADITQHRWSALLGTGLCGGLSTFSTFSVETVQLGREQRPLAAGAYVILSLLLGIGAAAVGWAI